MFIQMLWLMFVSFLLGITTGLLIKGIHVHINQKGPEVPAEPNLVNEDDIPQDHLKYAYKNNGFIE
jgi:hypothetical protein